MTNLLDLELIVLGGPMLQGLEQKYQQIVQHMVDEQILAHHWRRVPVELSTAKERAAPIGAAALVLYELYAPRLAGLRTTEQEVGGVSGTISSFW